MGLGVVASSARRVTDAMILSAARALGRSPALTDPSTALLPALSHLRKVAAHIATAVGFEAQRDASPRRRAKRSSTGASLAYASACRRADAPKSMAGLTFV